LAWDFEGRLYTGLGNGTIVRISPDGTKEHFAHSGWPLGLRFDHKGNLIVCDQILGLISINPKGKISVLSNGATQDGIFRKFVFTDFHSIGTDGKIYFSDGSNKWNDFHDDFLEGHPRGSLLVYDPSTETTTYLLKDKLYFPNGILLSPSQDFILISETFMFRISCYWLSGPKAGSLEIFMDGLPGFPDNLSLSPRGTMWVAFPTIRKPEVEFLLSSTFIKKIMYQLPHSLRPKLPPTTLVVEIDITEKKIIRSLWDPTGAYITLVSTVEEHNGYIFLGTLSTVLAKYKL